MSPVISEGRYRGEFLFSEACGTRSLETVTIDTGDLAAGTVLGRITKGAASAAAGDGNTGDGTCTGLACKALSNPETWKLICISAAAPTAGAATGAAVTGNTGDGTITAAPIVGTGAKVGVYRAVCIEPATNAGKFIVEDPDGITVGIATAGVEFVGGGLTFTIADGTEADFASGDSFTITVAAVAGNGGVFSVVGSKSGRFADASVGVAYVNEYIGFTINAGDTGFAVGDTFTITVAEGSGKYVAYNQDGVDGSEIAAGILFDNVNATDADVEAVIVARDAEVSGNELAWPADIEAGEKTAAIAQLASLGIIVR